MHNSVVWYGRSGAAYSFVSYSLDDLLDDHSGVYIFARPAATEDGWVAICVGETDSFSQYLPTHPKRQCARDYAATHLHVLPQEDEATRRAIVRDLIARWHPPCNQTLDDAICSCAHAVANG